MAILDHETDSGEHAPAISKRWKYATVFGNLALGIAELATGNARSLAVAADGLHNLGDAATYSMQSNDVLQTDMDAERVHRRRKIAHWAIAVSSGAIGIKAGLDLAGDASHEVNNVAAYAAGASLLYNGALLARLRQGIRTQHAELGSAIDCHQEDDLTKHLLRLDIPSAGLALGGVIAQKYGLQSAEQLAAIASGVLGVVAFRPTVSNLNHAH
jgi:divalent metal cation (Fe/Co/Zn/Cd) transporter